jgi:hypothetical protein
MSDRWQHRRLTSVSAQTGESLASKTPDVIVGTVYSNNDEISIIEIMCSNNNLVSHCCNQDGVSTEVSSSCGQGT